MFGRPVYNDQPHYEIAQICLNGHPITAYYSSNPEKRKSHCPKCGAKTITQCQNCNANIQGDFIAPGTYSFGIPYHPPSYCHNCGHPYPWTEMQLEAVEQLILITDELQEDKDVLVASLPDLTVDTPKTQLAISIWKKALGKLGEEAKPVFRQLLTVIINEAVKQALFPK